MKVEEVKSLQREFQAWYDNCVKHNLVIGPLNLAVIQLWSDVKNKNIHKQDLMRILSFCEIAKS
ncbi:hypothetical protein BFV95_4629 [Alteromonas macleodii]|uniref:Uncharacterized protein n=2 Tax=Alteromonas macleodii TaxID=28108 RepID=A0AB36FL02_ALTMA|nr:hypothetical protein BFV95_4629 [Alteromonas macleodii]